jgi:hypothetical protein
LEAETGINWNGGIATPDYGMLSGDIGIRNYQADISFDGAFAQRDFVLLLQYLTSNGSPGKLLMMDWLYELQRIMQALKVSGISGTYNDISLRNAFEGNQLIEVNGIAELTTANKPELGLSAGTVLYQFTLAYRVGVVQPVDPTAFL